MAGLPRLTNIGGRRCGQPDGRRPDGSRKMAAGVVAQQPRYPLVGESLQQLPHRTTLAMRSSECTEFI